jgi:hypothetical protein
MGQPAAEGARVAGVVEAEVQQADFVSSTRAALMLCQRA